MEPMTREFCSWLLVIRGARYFIYTYNDCNIVTWQMSQKTWLYRSGSITSSTLTVSST